MIRKFKLLKEIPELNTLKVGDIKEIETSYIEYPSRCTLGHIIKNRNIKYDPATRPDLWEEIKKKKIAYRLIKDHHLLRLKKGIEVFKNVFFIQLTQTGVDAYFYYDENNNLKYADIAERVENNPEFWQKVEEKDYEILSFLRKSTNKIFTVINGVADNESESFNYTLEKALEHTHLFSIYSVKRKDGEIFTVGDIVPMFNTLCTYKITSFDNTDGTALINGLQSVKISELKKFKEKLFTTEDGVNIFEGDEYWFVDLNLKMNISPAIGFTGHKSYTGKFSNTKILTFSTREKAESYVYLNKPRFSFEDVELAIMNAEILGNKEFTKNLIYTSLEKYCL